MSDRADNPRAPSGTLIDLASERKRRAGGSPAGAAPSTDASAAQIDATPEARADQATPVAETARSFDRTEVARLLGISTRRVRAWERAGLLSPTLAEAPKSEPRYSFRDLRAARIVRDLVRRGIAPARVRALLASLDRVLDEQQDARVRVSLEDGRVLARDAQGAFELPTGQRLLEFDTGAATVKALPKRARTAEGRTAYEWFLEGCRLDGDEATRTRAEMAFRKAIELDRDLACAWTNLGALRLAERDTDEALECFTRAMECDPAQPEAPYNVGYLLLERRQLDEAIPLLARAVALDAGFADAHFNLASALDEVGKRALALAHWEIYLELVPSGPFAEIARQRIERAQRS